MLGRNEESAWQRASASLDATAKIYGYRVDSVHTETFKFLGGLNRNKKDLNSKNENELEGQDESDISKKKEKIKRGINTLETNVRKLNLDKYDIDLEVDPLFSVMTSKFNESTARGLLLNTIPLDENINYILESKKTEDNPKLIKNLNEKISEEDKKEDNISNQDNSSQSDIDSGKIQNALNLANNLKKKELNEDNGLPIIPVKCSQDFEHISDDIKNVLKSFIKDNNVDEFIHLQICPDLTIFRATRQLNTEEAGSSFINAFKDEINFDDKRFIKKDFDNNNISIINEEAQDNLGEIDGDEGLGDIPDEISNADNNDNININNGYNNEIQENNGINYNENNNNFSLKLNESNLTLFKYDDLIERASHFGTGNTEALPQFMNFAKNFGKLDKNTFFNKGSILGIKKVPNARKKKEEKKFIFDEENEIDANELFNENRSKLVNRGIDYRFEQKRKVKCFYHFDKLSQFKLFKISVKTITQKDIDDDLDLNQQEKNLEENKDGDMDDGGWEENDNQNDIVGFEKNNDYDNFYQNEKNAEKNFGRLYRKFDIRALKKKIWTSYDDMKEEQTDFKNIVINMSKEMNDDELFSISTPTCFVCMLHLCNEKNLFIEQKDINTFYIDRDTNGDKSKEKLKKGYNLKDDNSSSDASD